LLLPHQHREIFPRTLGAIEWGQLVVIKLGESGRVIRMTGLGPGDFFGKMNAHRNAEPISHRRHGEPNRAVRAARTKVASGPVWAADRVPSLRASACANERALGLGGAPTGL
jgi:hypothetical protein